MKANLNGLRGSDLFRLRTTFSGLKSCYHFILNFNFREFNVTRDFHAPDFLIFFQNQGIFKKNKINKNVKRKRKYNLKTKIKKIK